MIATVAASRRPLLILCSGGAIGIVVAAGLYFTKTAYVAVLPVVLLVFVGAALFKNFRLYWFAVFLLSMQIPIAKNLNDGHDVIRAYRIDYVIWNFTYQITVTDLVFLVLLVIWLNDHVFYRKRFRFPKIMWLPIGYFFCCLLSLIGSSSPYLGFVQLWAESKFFLAFLFAINCLESKAAVRVLALVATAMILIQAAVTVARFETGFVTSFSVGDSAQDVAETKKYLAVDRKSGDASPVRGFGTLDGPAPTNRLLVMLMPFALFLAGRNAMFGMRWAFAATSALGMLGVFLTFTRVYYITIALQLALVFALMVRDRSLKRQEIILAVCLVLVALTAGAPKIYEQFSVRTDSVSVRLLQYEAASKMILDHPVLGVGLNNGNAEKLKYSTLSRNPLDPDTWFDTEPTHNFYLSMISEIGVVGTFFYLAFFVAIAVFTYKQSNRSSDPEVKLIGNVFFVAICGAAITGFMDPWQDYVTNGLLWMYAGMSLNLPRMEQESSSHK